MAVLRSHWRQGLATLILDRLLEIARAHDCTQVVLETTHARGFYERRGFRVVQQRQERGVTLAVMGLAL